MNHQAVPGIGICVGCRRIVCEACTTRLQGRNFCAECLLERVAPRDDDSSGDSLIVRLALGALSLASATLVCAAVTGVGFLLYLAG